MWKKVLKTLAIAAASGAINAAASNLQDPQHFAGFGSLGKSAGTGALIGVGTLFIKRPQDHDKE